MANVGLIILFICFGIGLFYCLPVTIRDSIDIIREMRGGSEDE